MKDHEPKETGMDELDHGLRAAFARERTTIERGSVLDALGESTASMPRVLLRDEPSDIVVDPGNTDGLPLSPTRGSYQILGELARGGMGVVMKSHDTDLGRNVAMKILRADLARKPSVLQRFVEEAQIGGQLQHPGIVPVYELGLMADERPFFTMRLVRGQTLAAILADQKSFASGTPSERRQLLDVFTSVCRTVAYAHSRGVIHRDLKPANVMVGSFGEVQVVDWGLANVLKSGGTVDEKRLRDSRTRASSLGIVETVRSSGSNPGSKSLAGSVMGTPEYMSPEQARGEVDELDERADVFTLGAVLCEILTGEPPYSGSADEALAQAATARLDRARRNLDACGADEALVELARLCLAPARDARPRHAGVLAERIESYLAATEDRARKAQLEAAEARGKAAEERRARKLTLALAASVLITVLVAGGAWTIDKTRSEERARRTTGEVNAALADAALLRGQARWTEALAAAERARALAAAGETDQALRDRVTTTLSAIEADVAAERADQERTAWLADVVARLERARFLDIEVGMPTVAGTMPVNMADVAARRSVAYGEVFASLDVDVDEDDLTDTALKLNALDIGEEIGSALDDWARMRGLEDGGDMGDRSNRLIELAMQVDDHGWRNDVRSAVLDGAEDVLLEMSRDIEADFSPATAMVLAVALGTERSEDAIRVLEATYRRHPDDLPLLLLLGRVIRSKENPHRALPYVTAAVALDPGNGPAHRMRGAALATLNDIEGTVASFRAAVEIDPNIGQAQVGLGFGLLGQGKREEAVACFEKAIELDPSDPVAHSNLGATLRQLGRLEEGTEYLWKAAELAPQDALIRMNLGVHVAEEGDYDLGIEFLREATELSPRFSMAHYNLGQTLADVGRIDEAVACYRKAIEVDPNAVLAHNNLAISLKARGDLDGAITRYERGLEVDPGHVVLNSNLAFALMDKGDYQRAAAKLERALTTDPNFVPACKTLGWVLATAPQEDRRDASRAMALAERTLHLDPDEPDGYAILGISRYRLGEFAGAVRALEKAIDMREGPRVPDWFYLAMALHEEGETERARARFDAAVKTMDERAPDSSDLKRFRAEAREVLELP